MTREDIEKKSMDYSGFTGKPNDIDSQVRELLCKAFVDGAQWRINSVWHDANEKPEKGRYILVDKEYRIQAVWKQNIEDDWLNDVNYFGVTRWAYVDDLLPVRKEETK